MLNMVKTTSAELGKLHGVAVVIVEGVFYQSFTHFQPDDSLTTLVRTNKDISSSLHGILRVKSCGIRVAYDMYYETLVVQQRHT